MSKMSPPNGGSRACLCVPARDRVPVWNSGSATASAWTRRAAFAACSSVGAVEAEWPAGRVRVSAYLGEAQLPNEIPGRVRCLVSKDDSVLVTWDINGNADCLPAGGAEPGEMIAETAYREVWEETAWHIDPASVRVLGWLHIESFAKPDPERPFPHPRVHDSRPRRSGSRRR